MTDLKRPDKQYDDPDLVHRAVSELWPDPSGDEIHDMADRVGYHHSTVRRWLKAYEKVNSGDDNGQGYEVVTPAHEPPERGEVNMGGELEDDDVADLPTGREREDASRARARERVQETTSAIGFDEPDPGEDVRPLIDGICEMVDDRIEAIAVGSGEIEGPPPLPEKISDREREVLARGLGGIVQRHGGAMAEYSPYVAFIGGVLAIFAPRVSAIVRRLEWEKEQMDRQQQPSDEGSGNDRIHVEDDAGQQLIDQIR